MWHIWQGEGYRILAVEHERQSIAEDKINQHHSNKMGDNGLDLSASVSNHWLSIWSTVIGIRTVQNAVDFLIRWGSLFFVRRTMFHVYNQIFNQYRFAFALNSFPTLFSYHFCLVDKKVLVFCHTALFIYELEEQTWALLKYHFVLCSPKHIFRVSVRRVANKAIPLSRHVL